jgi:hypothetical protein
MGLSVQPLRREAREGEQKTMNNKKLQAAETRLQLIPAQGLPPILDFFLDRNVKVHTAGLQVSGILRGFTGNQTIPHRPAILILETKRGKVLICGSWQKITLVGE